MIIQILAEGLSVEVRLASLLFRIVLRKGNDLVEKKKVIRLNIYFSTIF